MKRPVGKSFSFPGGPPCVSGKRKVATRPGQDQLSWIQDRCCSRRCLSVRCTKRFAPRSAPFKRRFFLTRVRRWTLLRAGSNRQRGHRKIDILEGHGLLGECEGKEFLIKRMLQRCWYRRIFEKNYCSRFLAPGRTKNKYSGLCVPDRASGLKKSQWFFENSGQ